MTDQLKQAAQQALEQLEFLNACYPHKTAADAIAALRSALTTSQPAQAGEVDDGDVTGQPGPLPETGWDEVPAGAFRKPSPTAGMNLGQRIKHVGGRENAAGYIEFGSVAAVRALVRQYLRDLPAPQQATHEPVGEPDTVPLDALHAAERERDYWKTRARAMLDHAEGTCWYWMGDGEDHLESLVSSLPVVIRADQLRELLARPAPGVPEGLVNALTLAANRIDRLSLELEHGSRTRLEAIEWAKEARLAAAQAKGADPEDLAAAGVMLMGRRTDHA